MDSLTQIVLGASVGEVVLGKKIGNKAMLWGAVAGTIPDLDVFIGAFQQTISHRGFTHSFFFAFMMSPILGYLMTKIFKKSKATFKEWTVLYFWGFITHILLDVQTIYGTELLWPFKNRLATGNVFVVDPAYTLPFLICVAAVMFYKRESKIRRNINTFGLVLSSSYLLLTMVIKGFTYKKFTNSLHEQHIEYKRIETGPTPLNAILWFATVETEKQFLVGYYSLFDKDDNIKFKRFDKNFELREKLKDFKNFKALNHFSKGWYLLEEVEDGIKYSNMRFGTPNIKADKYEFVFRYKLNINDTNLDFKEDFDRGDMKENFKEIFSRLLDRIKGNK